MRSVADGGDQDVPSSIDLRDPSTADEWVAAADRTRPWRVQIRSAIAARLRSASPAPRRVLELGAGPGLLAEEIMQVCSLDTYALFDFSQPMLDIFAPRCSPGRWLRTGDSSRRVRPLDEVVTWLAS